MVIEKTLECPLYYKDIIAVNSKGSQPWVVTGMIDAEAEAPTLATWCKELTHWKRPWWWVILKAEGEGHNRGWDGWMASMTQWTWVWANCKRKWRTGKPSVLSSMG